ncbi:class III signal peptide-containing protein [Thermococcus sp.]|uniref:class III signal peptide-containing protein n=1 Tax=Thermococcus sp. TaxID=35749 RepID=UPI00199DE905|nr:class III signal peptide-containing protein [Thermococcus sp.]
MINVKKLFRRKKGQGALEYLFMIAAALIIIFVVVRYISGTGSQATQQSDIVSLQSQAELAKSSLQAKGWWYDNYYVMKDSNILGISPDNTTNKAIANITISDSAYLQDIQTEYSKNEQLGTLYNNCMGGNETACKVLAALGGN